MSVTEKQSAEPRTRGALVPRVAVKMILPDWRWLAAYLDEEFRDEEGEDRARIDRLLHALRTAEQVTNGNR